MLKPVPETVENALRVLNCPAPEKVVAVAVPLTSSSVAGLVVPIPNLPVAVTRIASMESV